MTIKVTGDDPSDLQSALSELDADVSRFDSRSLSGADSILLLVQAAAPVIAAVGAEIIRWLRDPGRKDKAPRTVEVTLANGLSISISGTDDDQVSLLTGLFTEHAASLLPNGDATGTNASRPSTEE